LRLHILVHCSSRTEDGCRIPRIKPDSAVYTLRYSRNL